MDEFVKISQIEYQYSKSVNLFSNFDLVLGTNCIHGLFGKGGEGKTTLLKLIAGLALPQKGSILVNEMQPKKRNQQFIRNTFFLPEEIPVSNLSIKAFKETYSGFYPNFNFKHFHFYLDRFLINQQTPNIDDLTYSQKKKLFIAFGLATRARLILLDEPTSGMDVLSKLQFLDVLATLRKADRCIVISGIILSDLQDVVEKVLVLDNHKIIFNEFTQTISQKLLFETAENQETGNSVIYSEQGLNCHQHIKINETGLESKIDLDLLYNALIPFGNQINKILNA